MTDTPLWICCTLPGGREQAAHAQLVRAGITSLYLTRPVRLNRHHARARQRIVRRALLPGYALIGHDGTDDLEYRLRRIEWPGRSDGYRPALSNSGEIISMIERPFYTPSNPVITGILGPVPAADIDRMVMRSGLMDLEPEVRRLSPGDRARLTDTAWLGREVRIRLVKGDKAIVEHNGRRISTTLDKLEAAAP